MAKGRKVKYRPLNDLGQMECRICNEFKDLDDFQQNNHLIGSYGRLSKCRKCRNEEIKNRKLIHKSSKESRQKFINRFNSLKDEIFTKDSK